MPVKYRIYAIGDIGGVSKDNKLDTIGNEILIDLLKVEKDKDIIASIAIWLSVLASMNKEQINVIQNILDPKNPTKKSKPSKDKSAESNDSIWLFSAAGLFAVVLISFLALKSAKK